MNSPGLIIVLLWMFSFDSTFLSQLCVDILKSCRADEEKNKKWFQIWIASTVLCVCRHCESSCVPPCFHSSPGDYSPGLGLVGLWENCWAESRNMASSEAMDKRAPWSEKSRRSKPERRTRVLVFIFSTVLKKLNTWQNNYKITLLLLATDSIYYNRWMCDMFE